MIRFSLRQWFQKMASSPRRGRPASRPKPRTLLHIEDFEGRCVPSTVTTLADAGAGSLRQAILDTPAGGTVDFQPGLSGTITLTSAELAINKDLNVAGPGADVVTVSGNHASRVFDIAATSTVSLAGLTIADGLTDASPGGGGILNNGTLTVTGSTLRGNSATNGLQFAGGGGIDNIGTLTVTDSTLIDNSAPNGDGGGINNGDLTGRGGRVTVTGSTISGSFGFYGGGITNSNGTVTVAGSTLSGNNSGLGGGIFNNNFGSLTVTDSTLSGNSAGTGGGIITSNATLTVTDSTFSGNSAFSGGGGIDAFSGTATVTGSTFSGNSATGSGSTNGLGGGILNHLATLTVTGSAFSGNTASNSGGGVYNDGFAQGATLTVTDSAFSGNTASNSGGGIFSGGRFAVRGLVTLDGAYRQTASGTLTLEAGNTLILAGLGTIDGSLTNAGTLALGDATGPGQLTISLGLTNNGEISIAAGSTLTVTGGPLMNQAGAALTLGGTLTVTGDLINDGEIDAVGDSQSGGTQMLTVGGTLTNAPDGTIAPQTGDAFFLSAQVDNQGMFAIAEETLLSGSLTNSGTLTIASMVGESLIVTGGDVANSGAVLIGPGDILFVNGNYTQTAGSTELNLGLLSASGLVDLEGGVLGGTGTAGANVLNNAEVDVGQPGSPGTLFIVGNYTQAAGGVLVVEVGGPNAGSDFDRLIVTGQATLDGTLTVNLINGFVPNSGDSFQVLTFASGTGAFATIDGDGPMFTPSNDPMDVTLVAN